MGIDTKLKEFNLLPFILLIYALTGVFWLAANDIKAGTIYLSLMVYAVVLLFFLFIFIREEREDYHLKIPIDTNPLRSSIKFFIGFILPIIFLLIAPAFLKMMNPMLIFNVGSSGTVTSFAAVSTADKPFWQFFTVGPTASVIEEIWAMATWLLGMVIGWYISKRLGVEDNNILTIIIQVVAAAVFTGIFFMTLHQLNPIYTTTSMFISALVFRVAMSAIMFFSLGLEFTIAYHLSNNLVFLGWAVILPGLFSLGGLLLLLLIAFEGFMFIRRWQDADDAWEEVLTKEMVVTEGI
jgi:hypothetical protein